MALTVITPPPAIALVKNAVVTVLQTDNLVTTPGVKFKMRLHFGSGGPATNDYITFAWNGLSVTLTAVLSPDKTGLQVRDNSFGDYMDDYVQNYIIAALRGNYLLNNDFEFIYDATGSNQNVGYVDVIARRAGAEYTVDVSHSFNGFVAKNPDDGQPLYVSPYLGVTEVERENFRMYADVYVEETFNSGIFNRVSEIKADPDTDQKGIIYLNRVLKAFLEPDAPVINQNTITSSAKMLKRYYLRYAEAFGVPTQVQFLENTTLQTYMAILAGYAYAAFPANNFLSQYINATTGRKFLSLLPRKREIAPDGQQFLYYYNAQAVGDLQLRYNVFYSDFTSATGTILTKSALQQAVYTFPAGPQQLGLQALNPTKEITHYELYVQHSTVNENSEKVTFYINRDYFMYSNQFVYLNSLGGFDTIWCTGDLIQMPEGEGIQFERTTPYNYAQNFSAFGISDTWYQEYFQCATGQRSDLDFEQKYLTDFLMSEQIYWIRNNSFIPVTIKEIKTDDFREFDNSRSVAFSFSAAHINNAFTP